MCVHACVQMVGLSVRQKAELQDLKNRLRDKDEEMEALREEVAAVKEQMIASQQQFAAGIRQRPGRVSCVAFPYRGALAITGLLYTPCARTCRVCLQMSGIFSVPCLTRMPLLAPMCSHGGATVFPVSAPVVVTVAVVAAVYLAAHPLLNVAECERRWCR